MAFITLNGQLTKLQTITQQIRYAARTDTWTSNAAVDFYDPSGHLLANGCASASAGRFPPR